MQRAKAFFYVCAGLFLLAGAYAMGARSAQAQVGAVVSGFAYASNQAFVPTGVNGHWRHRTQHGQRQLPVGG